MNETLDAGTIPTPPNGHVALAEVPTPAPGEELPMDIQLILRAQHDKDNTAFLTFVADARLTLGNAALYDPAVMHRFATMSVEDTPYFKGTVLGFVEQWLPRRWPQWVREIAQRSSAQQKPSTFPCPETATMLLGKTFAPLRCFVEGFLAEGLTILAGKPKKGKSYLALDMSLAIAVGRQAFGKFATEHAKVLYVSLEDGERRLQRRLRQIQPNLATPDGLDFLYTFPRLGAGALEALQHYAQTYQVIIIDVLGRMLPAQTSARKSLSEYQEMTDVLGPIQQLAQEKQIAIVVIDHVRKASVEDDCDAIMGTQGKAGAADHVLIYGRKGEEKDGVVKVVSRDLEEEKFVLSMVDGHLEFIGKGEVYELDSEQNRIIKLLEEEGRPMAIPDIMKALGIVGEGHYKRFRVVMHRLYSDDRIGRTKRGLYRMYGEDRDEGVPF